MITVNMDKARAIKRDMIREERKPILEALDVQYMRAIEVQDMAIMAKVAIRKQALRDATKDPAIDAAATPEELKAVRPQALDV